MHLITLLYFLHFNSTKKRLTYGGTKGVLFLPGVSSRRSLKDFGEEKPKHCQGAACDLCRLMDSDDKKFGRGKIVNMKVVTFWLFISKAYNSQLSCL